MKIYNQQMTNKTVNNPNRTIIVTHLDYLLPVQLPTSITKAINIPKAPKLETMQQLYKM